jgi:hypothetical protein
VILLHAGSLTECVLRSCARLPTSTVVVPAHASAVRDTPLLVFVCAGHREELINLLVHPHVRDVR